ncbi:MAG: hypothetical protein VYC83_02515 [Chloroflexota bacterium]|nr:hypothetical protein [Chloroflexota bacterium]
MAATRSVVLGSVLWVAAHSFIILAMQLSGWPDSTAGNVGVKLRTNRNKKLLQVRL